MLQKTSLLALAIGLLLAGFQADARRTLGFAEESTIWIDGTSTLHDWTCEVSGLDGSVTIDPANPPLVNSASVHVTVEEIECGKGKMNKKLRNALRYEDHPTIAFDLRVSELADEQLIAAGPATVAGVTRDIEMTVDTMSLGADGAYRFQSSIPLRMSDFEVDPPSALLGTIKTGDEITIRFDVVTTRVN